MTNTEIWLDEITSHIQSVRSDMWMLREILSLPNCNDCKNKDCEYKPKWGEHIRYNCPLHADCKTEPQSGYCNECKWYGDKQVCGRCRSRNLYAPKTEPQPCEPWTKGGRYVFDHQEVFEDKPQTDCADTNLSEKPTDSTRSKMEQVETEPQTEIKVEPTWVGTTYGRFETEPQTDCAWK